MKIKVSKDYSWQQWQYESDLRHYNRGVDVTFASNYSGTWEEEDVTLEQLQEYINKGYGIKINC